MKIIVQKFGGTSVSSKEGREMVASRIIERYKDGYNVVVVVSAMGRKGDPYATDTLQDLVDRETVGDKEMDLLMSCGEIISSVVIAGHLAEKGYEPAVLTGQQAGILTNDKFRDAQIIDIKPKNILKHLNDNKIVIVPGFQGYNQKGEVTTLGRGGSDISAVAIGKALNSNYVEIFTDVDGIMTADPTIVPNARVLEKMSYSEVYQLAEDGAKVIHPRAVDLARQFNIPIVIKNTFGDNKGTSIEGLTGSFIDNEKRLLNNRIITAITYKKGRVQISIPLDEVKDRESIDSLMHDIALHRISLDLITFLVDHKIFTVGKDDKEKLMHILDAKGLEYKIVDNCCKISTIGYRMQGVPGVMTRIVRALSKENIKILQSSDSHNTIWCLIEEENTNKALAALHEEFKLHM
ncbi:MAG: aspartate kinase [Tissierellia bacterium]|nr:aspartate kinase [Tissierellia bacterium]